MQRAQDNNASIPNYFLRIQILDQHEDKSLLQILSSGSQDLLT